MRVREIARQLPFVSEQIVGKRLAQMHADGLLTRGDDLRAPYQLSEFGTSLAPVHQALTDWSHDHFHLSPGGAARAERVEDAVRRLHLRHTTAVIQALDAGPMRFVHIGEAVGLDDPYSRPTAWSPVPATGTATPTPSPPPAGPLGRSTPLSSTGATPPPSRPPSLTLQP
jgi:DNA-binding HxlR family transcriptional regulator